MKDQDQESGSRVGNTVVKCVTVTGVGHKLSLENNVIRIVTRVKN